MLGGWTIMIKGFDQEYDQDVLIKKKKEYD